MNVKICTFKPFKFYKKFEQLKRVSCLSRASSLELRRPIILWRNLLLQWIWLYQICFLWQFDGSNYMLKIRIVIHRAAQVNAARLSDNWRPIVEQLCSAPRELTKNPVSKSKRREMTLSLIIYFLSNHLSLINVNNIPTFQQPTCMWSISMIRPPAMCFIYTSEKRERCASQNHS